MKKKQKRDLTTLEAILIVIIVFFLTCSLVIYWSLENTKKPSSKSETPTEVIELEI